ncbi:MAG: YeeE/YedE family protein [Oligoflexia bacterium]|nr:YeeE/YedE family protein [Oligoflexia bacterium]
MLPVDVTASLGKTAGYLVFFAIGLGFGASLELAGFGDARRLAAQFYFRNMTVLKTMFTAIVVACVLIFLSSALGLLDFARISVNPTYLWPGIVGGLIMGAGFIIGGYCPGTSLVSAASFKLDGIAFLFGTLVGAGLFGESVSGFSRFWNSSFEERLLVSDWLGWSIGATVTGVAVLALMMFYAAEKTEEALRTSRRHVKWLPSNKRYLASGAGLLALALLTWALGQPDPAEKWKLLGSRFEPMLSSREAFVHPLEYDKTANDPALRLVTLDLRPKAIFEAGHRRDARNVQLKDLWEGPLVTSLVQLPSQGVVILVSEDEAVAVQAWQWLKAQGVVNLYILENDPNAPFTPKIKLKTTRKAGGLCS